MIKWWKISSYFGTAVGTFSRLPSYSSVPSWHLQKISDALGCHHHFHTYLGKIPILTNVFQRGCHHQDDMKFLGTWDPELNKLNLHLPQAFWEGGDSPSDESPLLRCQVDIMPKGRYESTEKLGDPKNHKEKWWDFFWGLSYSSCWTRPVGAL